MSVDLKKSGANCSDKPTVLEEQREKIKEVWKLLGELPDKLFIFCSDTSISRYLRARNWNVKKATKMLKETLKWRFEYKPEEIRWQFFFYFAVENWQYPILLQPLWQLDRRQLHFFYGWDEVAHEAETGKIYRSNYIDKFGRTVLVMRPGCQNTKSTKGQITYLVYCMENAILNLPPEQEQMVWLIDFQGFNMSNISVKVTRETAHVLQEHYPERLGLAILYNPPKFFESFWTVVKPFLEPKTHRKVKFVYSDDHGTKKIMEDLFDMEQLESAFGGLNQSGFNISDYAERMKEDDKRMPLFWSRENPAAFSGPSSVTIPCFNLGNSECDSDDPDKEHVENSSPCGLASDHSSEVNLLEINGGGNSTMEIQSSSDKAT